MALEALPAYVIDSVFLTACSALVLKYFIEAIQLGFVEAVVLTPHRDEGELSFLFHLPMKRL